MQFGIKGVNFRPIFISIKFTSIVDPQQIAHSSNKLLDGLSNSVIILYLRISFRVISITMMNKFRIKNLTCTKKRASRMRRNMYCKFFICHTKCFLKNRIKIINESKVVLQPHYFLYMLKDFVQQKEMLACLIDINCNKSKL